LADVTKYGQDHGVCPYFAIRRMASINFNGLVNLFF
jgi:hypothetical protein